MHGNYYFPEWTRKNSSKENEVKNVKENVWSTDSVEIPKSVIDRLKEEKR